MAKTPEKRAKLRMKISKAGGPGNFVLVKKNNFLFFEKGIGMKSKPNQKALLGNRLRIEQDIDNNSVASIEHSRSQSNVLNLLEGNSLDNTKIQGSLPKLKYVPSAKDCNHNLDVKRRNLKKVGKIVDPCKQEVKKKKIHIRFI